MTYIFSPARTDEGHTIARVYSHNGNQIGFTIVDADGATEPVVIYEQESEAIMALFHLYEHLVSEIEIHDIV